MTATTGEIATTSQVRSGRLFSSTGDADEDPRNNAV